MITFEGYSVEKDGKFLGYAKHGNKLIRKRQFYKRPKFPVVCATKESIQQKYAYLGRVVRVKLTMEIDEKEEAK